MLDSVDQALAHLAGLRTPQELRPYWLVQDAINTMIADNSVSAQEICAKLEAHRPQILSAARKQQDEVRQVIESIVTILANPTPELVNKLDKLVFDHDTRRLAATLLFWLGNAASSALPILVDLAAFENDATDVAQAAIIRIGSPEAEEAMLSYLEAVKYDDIFAVEQLVGLAQDAGFYAVTARFPETTD